ncbi:3a1c70c3-9774-410e-aefe-477ca24bdefa [Sclerotinia trifoliorum]|uniref:3a1c70c3-9774-410e-aefe-477ca24bdefa n=1 Tax=Sclerotinia trifoliorum TaxID=28548 RepID=A0A8H2VTF7_9HELO|nr:3a1c70c3-9774-410e-aefe-477ca24bdefa [Sclerotinia trifoliorum]
MASSYLAKFFGGSRPAPEDEGEDSADTSSPPQGDYSLPFPPPKLHGLYQEKNIWRQLWILYAWLFKSALYYIPFISLLIGLPWLAIYVSYTQLFLRDDAILPDLWKAPLDGWDAFSRLIRTLFWVLVNIVVKAASWFGIPPAWYHPVKTAVTSFVTGWYNSASAAVTTSTGYLSGLQDTTTKYITSSRLWDIFHIFHAGKWGPIIRFSKYFFAFSMSTYFFVTTSSTWDPNFLLLSSLMIQLGPIKRAYTYIIDYVKTLSPMMNIYQESRENIRSFLSVSNTYSSLIKWLSAIGGDTSVSILPEPEPGQHELPAGFQISTELGERFSKSTLGEVLTGSQLGEAIKSLRLSETVASSDLRKALAGSVVGGKLAASNFGQSSAGSELLGESLSGSILGDILLGSDTQKRIAISRLGRALAKSEYAATLVGFELVDTLTESELASRITEELDTQLGLVTHLRDLSEALWGPRQRENTIKGLFGSHLGEVLTKFELGEILEGSRLGEILTGKVRGPTLPRTRVTAERIKPPRADIPPEHITPTVDTFLPMVTKLVAVLLEPLAPVVAFLTGSPSNTTQTLSNKPKISSDQIVLVTEPVLPVVTKVVTIFLKPIAPVVAFLSSSLNTTEQLPSGTSTSSRLIPSLEISFDPAKVSLFATYILALLFAFGFYISLRHYLNAWSQTMFDAPLPPEGIPPPAGQPSPEATGKALPRSRESSVWSIPTEEWHFPPPLNRLPSVNVLFAYVRRPFSYIRWLLTEFQDHRFPLPPLSQIPLISNILAYIIRLYAMFIQLFADIRQQFSALHNIINLYHLTPLQAIFDALAAQYALLIRLKDLALYTHEWFIISMAYLFWVMMGWETDFSKSRVYALTILGANRSIRSHFWTGPLTRSRRRGRGANLRRHHFPGFARGRHRSLLDPQWFPLFHVMIGSVIGSLICLTAAADPDDIRDVLFDTSKLYRHQSQELYKGYDYGKLLVLAFCATTIAYFITPGPAL